MTPGDLALDDLHRVLRGALSTASHLLTAGERVIVRRLLALEGPPGRLWVRLAARRSASFRQDSISLSDVPDVEEALLELAEHDLVHRSLPWSRVLALLRVPELKALCRQRGHPVGGRREALVERLLPEPGPAPIACWRLSGRTLVRRLERVWFQSGWRDRGTLLLERIGQVQWVDYPLSAPQRAFERRTQWRAFEASLHPAEPQRHLQALQHSTARGPAHRGLDARRYHERHLAEALRELERAGEHAEAAQGYAALLACEPRRPGEHALRLAQCLDKLERPAEGAAVCVKWRARARPEHAASLERSGRRLAKKAKGHWRPARPLLKAPERTLQLPAGPKQRSRPTWGEPPLPIERAVLRHCGPRLGEFAENGLWTTIFGLVCFDLLWLPIPGMLPVPGMDGPLDLGTAAFVRQRAAPFAERLEQLRQGLGAEILARHHAQWGGAQVRGVHAFPLETLLAVTEACGPALAAVVERLGKEGWSAARGLPDLVFLPGEHGVVPDLVPSRLPEGLLLVEVKGPTDALRDAQRVWHDHLLRAGLAVEIWKVSPCR